MQYLGESHGNFNADMWYVEQFSNTDIVTNVYKKYFLGIDFQNRDFSKGGIFPDIVKCVQFYTTVGTFYGSYGPFLTIVIILLSTIIFYRLIKMKKITSLSCIVLYVFYARIPLMGMFCFAYAPDVYQLVTIPFVFVLLKLFEQFSLNTTLVATE